MPEFFSERKKNTTVRKHYATKQTGGERIHYYKLNFKATRLLCHLAKFIINKI